MVLRGGQRSPLRPRLRQITADTKDSKVRRLDSVRFLDPVAQMIPFESVRPMGIGP